MNREEYQHLSMRTAPEIDIRSLRLNACLGLIGEVGEVADLIKKWRFQSRRDTEIPKDKLVEEIGDVFWYCALYAKSYGFSIGETKQKTITRSTLDAEDLDLCVNIIHAGIMAGTAYNDKSADAAFVRVDMILRRMDIILYLIGSDESDCMERNINKLIRRYPQGFDVERSMNRTE